MDAIKALGREHAVVERVLNALEGYVERIAAGKPVEPADLRKFSIFFQEFVDLNHHEKEEDMLLPALDRAGLPWDNSPLQQVRQEHQQERYLVRSLDQAWPTAYEWTVEDLRHIESVARELLDFQRKHKRFEEEVLFVAARRVLSQELCDELAAKFQEFDLAFGRERYAGLVETANGLYERYANSGS